ncbi:MAG: ABC transporter permease [Clostridiales bacterium]|jgi:simple sugar transport system permease protein|nr:ABC transporter permease [Clostridiales bacterium]
MKEKKNLLKNPSFQAILTSLLCIVLGLLIGYIVLLLINPAGAGEAIGTILINFLSRNSQAAQLKALGNTLAKTAPLLMCALSICFCYKVGLFNIGAAGQYEAGACMGLYAALAWHMPWFVCLVLAAIAGAVVGAISGALKAYRNVNEVISGIMLNWILLYLSNMILVSPSVKDVTSPYTIRLASGNPKALIPTAGLNTLFANNKTVTLAIPLSILFAILIWVILTKTKFGYELRATGFNKEAAKYAGMKEKQNIIITLAIGGALAGIGASFLFLSGYQEWSTTQTSVPAMGFNGIAATFLGGLHPIGTIFASFFIQSITDGGALINKSVYPSQISDLISSIIIYLCGFVLFFKFALNNWVSKREAQVSKVDGQVIKADDKDSKGGDK